MNYKYLNRLILTIIINLRYVTSSISTSEYKYPVYYNKTREEFYKRLFKSDKEQNKLICKNIKLQQFINDNDAKELSDDLLSGFYVSLVLYKIQVVLIYLNIVLKSFPLKDVILFCGHLLTF